VFEPLKGQAYFRRVRVDPEVGTIVWPNGEDVCPDVLYAAGALADASGSRTGAGR
jgi:hypothetical protein